MGSFFGFFMIANQWLTNCQLEDTNDLLEQIRRQGMTPAERKAEDARRAYTTRAWIAVFALIILFSAFFIFSAVENTQDAAHLKSDAELDAEYAAMAHHFEDGN